DCFEKKLINVDHIHTDENVADLLTKPFDAGRFQYLVCKLFPMMGKLSTVSVFLGFGLTFAGTSKYWGVLRILMIGLRLIPLSEHNIDFHPMVDFVEASPLRIVPFFDIMLIQQSDGSGTPTEPHHTPSQEAYPSSHTYISSPSIPTITSVPTVPIPTVIPYETTPIRQYTRRARIAQSSALPPVADEPASPEVEINRLKERVKQLKEREGVAAINSRDDAPIKERQLHKDGSIPTASTPAKGSVPTGNEEVPTASPVFATATVVTPYRRRKGKEVMVESETHKKQKVQEQIDAQVARDLEEQLTRKDQKRAEQIAKDAEIARIHAKEELPMEKRIELISDLAKDFKGMTFEEVHRLKLSQMFVMEDFIPMGSKEEAEKIKRKEVTKEKIKEMMQLVPIEEVYVEELQVKHPIIDWQVHTEGQRAYWKITRLGDSSASYQFFTNLLKHLDRDDLNQLWSLGKETLSRRPTTSDKEMELWVEVHQLTLKDKNIFMLVEKDYPLRKGLAFVMICYKLQVENYSQMADDLVRKIYNIANSPRKQGD
nr:hypothetical protein [Tanacetum cinerariifolium]